MKKCAICGKDVTSGVIVDPECVQGVMEAKKVKATARERLIVELLELENKSNKLAIFMHCSDIFNKMREAEKELLKKQLLAMNEYGQILKERLLIWEDKE